MRRTKKHALYALVGLGIVGSVAAVALFESRPVELSMTPRIGDDTVVVNQTHRTRLSAWVVDRYGRHLPADTTVQYHWMSGDSIPLSSDGKVQCNRNGDAAARATFGGLSRDFALRCRPVASVEAASWLDLIVGDSSRDLSFVAHGPDGRTVTELRGAVTVGDGSVVAIDGTAIRAKRAGATFVSIEVGDVRASIPILVYQAVESFVDNPPRLGLMAMPVSLARGDTIETSLPKAAFWVTYISKDRKAAPPTIELVGEGLCTTGNGLNPRRIEDGEYAKYCYSGNGSRMRIAHGASGADLVRGTLALRVMW